MSFNVDELTYLIFNQNKEAIQKWKKVQEICANDPLLKNDPTDYSKSRSELFELYSRKSARFHKLVGYDEDTAEIAVTIFPEQIITILSIKMFAPTIKNLGTERQVEKWLPPTLGFEIIGCYAQTELGHGSDVQSLETEAVYDAETEEFVLHSPTMTSTKWWVGDLGIFATHCVTHANLIIGGKNHGIQTFIVPLRDTKTFEPLPGISVGDIGPKIGYNAKDNGYVRFNYVRIPRENMLMRYSKVTKNGEFTKAMNEKIGYATMMQVRTSILRSAYAAFSAGITIALRYSLTRTQFKDDKGVEIPIFEY
jgi:acyl-CoA oxidase